MEESIYLVDTTIETADLVSTIHGLPHALDHLHLERVRFESLSCMSEFVLGMRNRKINKITIDSCVMTYVHLAQIVEMLEIFSTTALSLVNMSLDDRMCEVLSVFGTSLTHLNVAHNLITERGLEFFLGMKLSFLDVSSNPISSFTRWVDLFHTTKTLSLRGCFLSSREHFLQFCESVSGVEWNLNTLDLSNNRLDSYMTARFLFTSGRARIDCLWLCDNVIGNDVSDSLMRSKHIRNVYLDRNVNFTDEGLRQVIDKYTNSNIGHVSVRGCSVSSVLVRMLEEINMCHRAIPEIDLWLKKIPLVPGLKSMFKEFL